MTDKKAKVEIAIQCPVCTHHLVYCGKEPYEMKDGFQSRKIVYACPKCRDYHELNIETGKWITAWDE